MLILTNFRSRCLIYHFLTLLNYFLPVLPTLRLITSSTYLIPLPLYGSGLLLSLISAAAHLGTVIGKKAVEAGIESVVFDRGGYIYHGKVKALADAAREAGLKF